MQKVLAWIGILFLILVAAVAATVGYLFYMGHGLDASSKAYVDESVPAIVADWSKEELIKRASPRFLQNASTEEIKDLFVTLANKLGDFRKYDGAKGQAYINFDQTTGRVVTAQYVANATFQYGKAEIRLLLTQTGGTWEISGFHVNIGPL